MEIRIFESARDDLREGARFYELQSAGLGEYFLNSMHLEIETLITYAGVHAKFEGYHRMLTKRFPFAIFYEFHDERIDIFAVVDCRRDPRWITSRLKDLP